MARVKLSEYRAKQLLSGTLQIPYTGVSACYDGKKYHYSSPLVHLPKSKEYVVKVDQGVKGRMKKGLVMLHVLRRDIAQALATLSQKGFSAFLIEPYLPHAAADERYISLERVREGILLRYALSGGIDIEEMHDAVISHVISPEFIDDAPPIQIISVSDLRLMLSWFQQNHVSFLEINPLLSSPSGRITMLDLAVEVDGAAAYFVNDGWTSRDIVSDVQRTEEEAAVYQLNAKSQAAFSHTVLAQNGSIWCLLSGGGASVTIADEVYHRGFGHELGNYGEYSGNPNQEETAQYGRHVLRSMLKSNAKRLVLVMGGGVANFTDVRVTFAGMVQALEEVAGELVRRHVHIYVRRGGPHEAEGLAMISAWMQRHGLSGYVAGHALPLHQIVHRAVSSLSKPSKRL